jgi:dimethylamine/trimethylamine dehydrogenase
MSRDPRHDILFEPIAIGPKTLRNRFFQVPHCTGFGTVKPGTQAAHRGVKAEGGWGGVCTEDAPVSLDSDETPYHSAHLYDERDLDNLALMCDHVHAHGSLAGIELAHAGVHTESNTTRWHAIGPSALASDLYPGVVPRAMELADIRRVQGDMVLAARRAASVGFDIVYAYGAHAYLPGQFLSTHYNHRTDAYGGSLVNRARFWLELLEQLRAAVGDTTAIAVRIAVGLMPGVTTEEALEFVRLADPLVDLWDVNVGSLVEWSLDSGTSRYHREGYQLEWTGRVREVTAKPIVGVSRMTSPDRMAEIVRSGAWDIIGAARPSIADPFLPRKIEEGRYADIRECTGSNVCIMRAVRGHLGCVQNPTAGEEYRRGWHPERVPPLEDRSATYLVVGGGPSGMECAMTLGRRGAKAVHVVDADAALGGAMRWIARLPDLGEWGRVINHRQIQLDRLRNVETITGTRLDAAAVLDYGADVVIVATGSRWALDGRNAWNRDGIPGADATLAHVLTPEQVMVDGKRPPGSRVVVYDAEGYFAGVGVAQALAREGFAVEVVTPFGVLTPRSDETLEGPELRRSIEDDGIRVRRDTTVTGIAGGTIEVVDPFGRAETIDADAIVLCTQREATDGLYHELAGNADVLEAAGIRSLLRVGDCVTPRSIADVVWDGHRLAREIEGPTPMLPLPAHLEIADRSTLRWLTV